ncbi:hypothetical protein [Thermanaerovibrio acidaminovorans]|nr:hypothetical protein [Thermanaerovibrio acidaminovorans]
MGPPIRLGLVQRLNVSPLRSMMGRLVAAAVGAIWGFFIAHGLSS